MNNKITKGLLYLAITLTVIALALFTGRQFIEPGDKVIFGHLFEENFARSIAQGCTWIGVLTWIAYFVAVIINKHHKK